MRQTSIFLDVFDVAKGSAEGSIIRNTDFRTPCVHIRVQKITNTDACSLCYSLAPFFSFALTGMRGLLKSKHWIECTPGYENYVFFISIAVSPLPPVLCIQFFWAFPFSCLLFLSRLLSKTDKTENNRLEHERHCRLKLATTSRCAFLKNKKRARCRTKRWRRKRGKKKKISLLLFVEVN